jgi:hypothetical protein
MLRRSVAPTAPSSRSAATMGGSAGGVSVRLDWLVAQKG